MRKQLALLKNSRISQAPHNSLQIYSLKLPQRSNNALLRLITHNKEIVMGNRIIRQIQLCRKSSNSNITCRSNNSCNSNSNSNIINKQQQTRESNPQDVLLLNSPLTQIAYLVLAFNSPLTQTVYLVLQLYSPLP